MIRKIPDGEGPTFEDFCGEGPELVQAMEAFLLKAASNASPNDLDMLKRPYHTLKGILGFIGLKEMASLVHEAEGVIGGQLGQVEISLLLECTDFFRRQISLISAGLASGEFECLDCSELKDRVRRRDPREASSSRRDTDKIEHGWVRVGAARLDALLEEVGELAVCQAQVLEGLAGLRADNGLLLEARRLGKISRRLQDVALSLRMVPVQPLFSRIQRLIHDLAPGLGKKARLESSGAATELDKALVDELSEPLIHLLRNALDHGIETPEARRMASKAEEGCLTLNAQHQGGDFVLSLEDDGRGLDEASILEKAAELGLDRSEGIEQLILRPGFSTKGAVTEISGRGVGLDVVAEQVRRLNGTLRVESTAGRGCRFTLRLPLSMAVMDAILFRAGRLRYLLPAHAVGQFIAGSECRIHESGVSSWVETRGMQLARATLDGAENALAEGAVALVVDSGGKKVCVMADEVLGRRQVVVKALDSLLSAVKGVSGAAVLGDGTVAMVLDLEKLRTQARERSMA